MASASSSLDLNNLAAYIEQFSGELGPFTFEMVLPSINRCFSAPKIEDILLRLEVVKREGDPLDQKWATDTLQTLSLMSPTALAATLQLLQKGQGFTFKECLNMEFNLAKNFLERVPDMREGITAKLVKKPKEPVQWNPPSISKVKESTISQLFTRNATVLTHIDFLSDRDYQQYPHAENSLPTTDRIKALIETNRHQTSLEQVIDQYCAKHHEKLGLRRLLNNVIQRHVKTREQLEKQGLNSLSGLAWKD